jgi:hypothetical protein
MRKETPTGLFSHSQLRFRALRTRGVLSEIACLQQLSCDHFPQADFPLPIWPTSSKPCRANFRVADQPERTRKTGTSKVNRDEGSNRLDYFRVADHPRRIDEVPKQ